MVGLGEIKLIQQFFIFNFKLVSSGLKSPSLILLIKNSFRVNSRTTSVAIEEEGKSANIEIVRLQKFHRDQSLYCIN